MPLSTLRRPRKVTTLVAAGLTVLLALTACGDTESAPSADSSTVRIDHVYGHTDVPVKPKDVISLVPGYTDALLVLGEEPSAVAGYAGFQSAMMPWEEGKLHLKPEGNTEVLKLLNPSYVPIEEIATREPDVVLGSSLLSSQESYDRLSEIAPAVPALHKPPQLDDWTEQTRVVGTMMDKKDEAEKAINDVHATLDAVAAEYPGVKGATVAVAFYGGPDNIQVVSDPEDVTMKTLSRIGLKLPPQLEHVKGGEGGNQARLSLETLDKLDADIIIVGSLGDTSGLTSSSLWQNLKAVKNDRVITLDPAGVTAFRVPTILSVPWSLGLLKPALEKLKNEATENPQ